MALDRSLADQYAATLTRALAGIPWDVVGRLEAALARSWREGRQVFLCGNGGSAANAMHLANDLLFGIDRPRGRGLRVTALPANASLVTCLANDTGYEHVFSTQLAALSMPGDIVIVLSGSGNSPNILRCLETAKTAGVESFAVLGYDGGKAKALADHAIHCDVHDMQVAEDLQLVIGHVLMRSLCSGSGSVQ